MKYPEKVTYYLKSDYKTKDMTGKEIIVFPAFPSYPESEARAKTGKAWVKNNRDGFMGIVNQENKFHGLTILSLEIRGEGGRAYKVVDDKNNLFDMRENTLLDIIKSAGIQKGGYVDDDFCWVIDGSQMRIVRVGSDEYNKAVTPPLPKLKLTELVVGKSYEISYGLPSVFLGNIRIPSVYGSVLEKQPETTPKKKVGLFLYIEHMKNGLIADKGRLRFEFKSSGVFTERLSQIKFKYKDTQEILDFLKADIEKDWSRKIGTKIVWPYEDLTCNRKYHDERIANQLFNAEVSLIKKSLT